MRNDFIEYAPAPESLAIVKINKEYGHYIAGKFVSPHSKKRFATINPATEEILSHIALGGVSDVDKAVMAAQKAYDTARGEYDAMCKEKLGLVDGEAMNVVQLAALVDRLV